MAGSERDVHLKDGRKLRVVEEGDSRGRPVFVLHGTPGSRLLYSKHVRDATQKGIRLIGYDRPGYGGSTPMPGRRIVDSATDVGAIADALGLDRFAVWGHSGGGAPALACAASLPKRVIAASCLASPAPFTAEGLDQFEGMGELNVAEFQLMLSDRPAWEKGLAEQAEMMKHQSVDQVREFLTTLLSDVDRAVLTGSLLEFLHGQAQEGMRPGAEGWKEDSLWGIEPWGFELSEIRIPLQLWHGRHDRFVPFSHGEWLAVHLPRAEHHLEPTEGHVSLFENRIPEVHDWLLSHF
jgi:pimeloyl-ACP methyl ester carboxylesterase